VRNERWFGIWDGVLDIDEGRVGEIGVDGLHGPREHQ
jgi:hypothetical protein